MPSPAIPPARCDCATLPIVTGATALPCELRMTLHRWFLPLGLALAPLAQPTDPPARTFPRGADCLDPQRARGWLLLDSDEVLVDAGRRRYHLQLAFACPELEYNHEVVFRGASADGRICGLPGDRIETARPGLRRHPCTIGVVTRLTPEEYDAIQARGGQRPGEVTVREVPER